jgi:hypothetical protein
MTSDVDTTPSFVTDHPFIGPPSRLWDRCVRCGLAEAAHRDAIERYVPNAQRAPREGRPS